MTNIAHLDSHRRHASPLLLRRVFAMAAEPPRPPEPEHHYPSRKGLPVSSQIIDGKLHLYLGRPDFDAAECRSLAAHLLVEAERIDDGSDSCA